jgi:hypothetical protein
MSAKQFNLEKFGAALVKPADVAKLPPRKIIASDARQMQKWIAGEIERIGVRPFARLVGSPVGTVHSRKRLPSSITIFELAGWGPALGYRLIMSIQ